jgi:hypothetical protein
MAFLAKAVNALQSSGKNFLQKVRQIGIEPKQVGQHALYVVAITVEESRRRARIPALQGKNQRFVVTCNVGATRNKRRWLIRRHGAQVSAARPNGSLLC